MVTAAFPRVQVLTRATSVDPARPIVAALLLALLVLFLLSRWLTPEPWQSAFAAYLLAYTLEAAPFIMLGALLSGLMETFLPSSILTRLTARLGAWGVPAVVLLSPLFPTCECGVVAIGRGLLRKGLPLGPALAYLLAAPILNPTVLWATWIAFQDMRYVLWRAGGAFLVACGVGLWLGRTKLDAALQPNFAAGNHEHDSPSHGAEPISATGQTRKPSLISRLLHAASHARQDFGEMMLYFLCGVAIASAMKTFLSATVLTHLGHGAVSGPATLMGTSFTLSLCSEADAFPAAGFTEFGFPAKLAFLVLGPMLDIKLLLMYRTLFRGRFLALYSMAIVLGVALFAAVLTLIGGAR